MSKKHTKKVTCQICKKGKSISTVIPAESVRGPLMEFIQKTYPDWSTGGFICIADRDRLRAEYVTYILEGEKGELSLLEEQVSNSFKESDILSKNINVEFDQQLSFGDRLSDKFVELCGSWNFIILFALSLLVWVAINSVLIIWKAFDPYPFILLNLVLSCLAAVQAPIIMMSQNRQESKDRLRAEHDYRINLKAELEIRTLHEKIDHILVNQWQKLLQIQELQMDIMEEYSKKKGSA